MVGPTPFSLAIDFGPPPTKKYMRDTESHINLVSPAECLDPPLGVAQYFSTNMSDDNWCNSII